jgi:succinate-semialdehyde dehydrogenase / glutarate-semialdehyde dehydrogenase
MHHDPARPNSAPTSASINPATGQIVAEYPEHSDAEVNAIIERAAQRFASWRRASFAQRSALMHRVSDVLLERCDEWAELMAIEMGKPLREGRAELAKSASVCRYYADGAEAMLADREVATDSRRSFVHYEPLGVILAVMPWNFPFWQVIRFAAPTLMAGNTVLLKHASNVTGSALAIEESFTAAGFDAGCFSTLVMASSRVASVIEHPEVRAVSLTGSEGAGRAVGATAGRQLKKAVLELGGSDASVVLSDADVANAAAGCAAGRLINGGQSCIAAKRFIVHEAVYDEWLDEFTRQMASRVSGNPIDEATTLGPLARVDLRDELHDQVLRSVEAGARILLGGTMPDDRTSAFYPATVLVDVPLDSPAWVEELFGPVAAVVRVSSDEEAIELANQSRFGLGGAVYTSDVERGLDLAASQVEAGTVFVNGPVASDPRLPFGGIRESGYGRELGEEGIREFVNVKTVVAVE